MNLGKRHNGKRGEWKNEEQQKKQKMGYMQEQGAGTEINVLKEEIAWNV